jgi:hypothetical protein
MNSEKQRDEKELPAATEPAVENRRRRRLLQGGVSATPLLMTLVSRPVLGHSGFRCVTPSGYTSMPSSRQPEVHRCDGGTPGFWKQEQHFKAWPAGFYPVAKKGNAATLFGSHFLLGPYAANTTFLQILESMGGPPDSVARHIVAALLNALRGWTTVLTPTAIKDMWADYITTGFFEPTAGVRWYHDQIQDYLESTMQRD